MKKIFSIALAFLMVMNVGNIAKAKEVQNDTINDYANQTPVISSSDEYLAEYADGTKIVAAFRNTDNGLVKLTKEEYNNYLQQSKMLTEMKLNSKSNKVITPRIGGVPFTWYKEFGSISKYPRTDLQIRISNIVENHTSQITEYEFQSSYTKGFEASISVSSGDISAIELETGFSCNESYTFSQTLRQPIQPQTKAWIEFYPIMSNSWGNLQYGVSTDINPFYVITSEEYVDLYFPRKLVNGQLDGVYLQMEEAL